MPTVRLQNPRIFISTHPLKRLGCELLHFLAASLDGDSPGFDSHVGRICFFFFYGSRGLFVTLVLLAEDEETNLWESSRDGFGVDEGSLAQTLCLPKPQ
jgi:hypothetical protein